MVQHDPAREPRGALAIRTLAMPAYTNPNGQIFGGWVVSQMDLAGVSIAHKHTAEKRLVTVAIDKIVFVAPVHVGDFICCYGECIQKGRSSITVKVETWAVSKNEESRRLVTEGVFTFVVINEAGEPIPA